MRTTTTTAIPPPSFLIQGTTSREHSDVSSWSSSSSSSENENNDETDDNNTKRQLNNNNNKSPILLSILHSSYQSLRNPRPWRTRYVTQTLQDWVVSKGNGFQLQIPGEFNHKFGDPCPGELKSLFIRYAILDSISHKTLMMREIRWIESSKRIFTLDAKKIYKSVYKPKSPRAAAAAAAVTTNSNFSTQTTNQNIIIKNPFFPHVALSIIVSFLPVYPDRLHCRLVCKAWKRELNESGLTTEFRIGGDYFPTLPNYTNLPPPFVEMIVKKSSASLRTLDLSGYSTLTDQNFIQIIMNAPQLRDLNLTDCDQLTDTSLSLIGKHSIHLISLTVKRVKLITDISMVSIANGCGLLQRLDLSEVEQITDHSLIAIATHLQSLVALFLRESHLITDLGGNAVFQHLNTLREISLWGMHRLTNHSFTSTPTIKMCTIKLRSITLEGCFGISDETLETLAKTCSLLVSLNLKHCYRITDYGLDFLSKFSRLQHLNLCYVKHVSDRTLTRIGKDNSELKSIDLSHCSKITNLGIKALCTNLTWISEFRLCSCLQFSNETVKIIAQECIAEIGLIDMRNCDGITITDCLKILRDYVDDGFVSDYDEPKCFYRMVVGGEQQQSLLLLPLGESSNNSSNNG
jgi:hypothetical protein